ncbi:hypothetical protein AKJ37_04525 [candidate division MSBL1 archaeon SCGC-AAA259I09]|uniref:Glutamate-1-semialdehyde 2,1-aminomutase n=2 Tax=candidate division MSBL1 TaxID=215777 RepID=A0A133URB3_9EURY|nr:hypothetical protein AKJ66_03665 [candidate division MSBL1 archaeon SCGC-AAA259E22]KXA96738.1 hypothetical protein AKJ37_04525 [candidate division MSBL1 archaeon SCGC-AAA259I09]
MSKRKFDKSKKVYERARDVVPSGTSSNFRGHPIWDPHPISLESGEGSKVYDVDGNEYIDMFLSFGPMILGHSHPKMQEAVKEQIEKGTMLGTVCELEAEVAEKFCEMVPCADMVRFTNSGTESTMHAIRTARAYTGKEKILKFEGNYHGMHDYVLANVHPPKDVRGLKIKPNKIGVPGVPDDTLNSVMIAPWNEPEIAEKIIKRNANELGAVIVEPVAANMGTVLPKKEFLETLREQTEKHDIIFIFDEVMTGFRIARGGAQEYFDIKPDMATFSKALGGGYPIGAFTGKKEIMGEIHPEKIPHGGTYNANQLCLAATQTVLNELDKENGKAYDHMYEVGEKIINGIEDIAEDSRHQITVQGLGPIFQMFFTEKSELNNWREIQENVDFEKFKEFAWECLDRGVYIFPSVCERNFVSTAHTTEDADKVIETIGESLNSIDE